MILKPAPRKYGSVTLWVITLLMAIGCQGEIPPPVNHEVSSAEPASPGQVADHVQDERPNIVLYISDDHGLDAYGAYGATAIQTPNLDTLAEEGTRFTHAFATSASCAVSRSVMMSGLHGHTSGMYGHMHGYNHFSSFDRVRSLPVLLSESGYRTGRVGKYHLAPESVYRFDVAMSEGKANDMKSIGRSPVEMAEATREFILSNPGEPFFLLMGSDDPHRDAPSQRGDKPNTFGNRPEGYPGVEKHTFDPGKVDVPSFLPDIPQTRLELAQYYESDEQGWDEVYASHTFHEVTMYYPMRTVRTRDYKLIWNIAWRLEYPFASDLFAALTWRGTLQNELGHFGKRKVQDYLFRPRFELYDLENDPDEAVNLADDPAYDLVKEELTGKLKEFQESTGDPWLVKWRHE